MSLRCGGVCNDHFGASFVLSQAVKVQCLVFWTHSLVRRK